MRAAALLLVLSLGGPSIATLVCDFACEPHHPRATNPTKSPTRCHASDDAREAPTLGRAAQNVCHDHARVLAAVLTTSVQAIEHPTVLQPPSVGSVDASIGAQSVRPARFRSADILQAVTPLRI